MTIPDIIWSTVQLRYSDGHRCGMDNVLIDIIAECQDPRVNLYVKNGQGSFDPWLSLMDPAVTSMTSKKLKLFAKGVPKLHHSAELVTVTLEATF